MTRLEAVESLITDAQTIADVGCDHGLIAKYCALSGRFQTVIASDISEKCLNKARSALGDNERVKFAVCDGIGYDCDEAVIAGMGGYTVCDILTAADKNDRLPEILVLLPHRDADAVRRRLTELGYRIDKDFIVKERGKFYSAIRAKKGDAKPLSELQYIFGTEVDKYEPLLTEYLTGLQKIYEVAPKHNEEKLKLIRAALNAQGADRANNNKE